MKLRNKIIILLITHIVVLFGGFLIGRKSIEIKERKYTEQLRTELNESLDRNRELQDNYSRIESENNRIRAEITQSRDVLNSVRYSLTQFESRIETTGNIIDECIELVKQLREIDTEFEEKK